MRIDIWSDVVCPWCAIGRVRLRRALGAEGVEAEVRHRAFELDPGFTGTRPTHDVLRERYGPAADVEAMTGRVRELAAAEGLDLRPAGALAANTFDAHRLLLWAQGQGRWEPLMDGLVDAHFRRFADVSDRGVLLDCAARAGLDADAAGTLLGGDGGADEVRRDEEEARRLGVRGVPFFLFDGKLGVSGAQPVEAFRQAVRRAASGD